METNEYVTIRIKRETRQRLKNTGKLGDTYDSLINIFLDGEQ